MQHGLPDDEALRLGLTNGIIQERQAERSNQIVVCADFDGAVLVLGILAHP